MEEYNPQETFLRVATACPEVQAGDVAANVRAITALYKEAVTDDTALVVFPELSITGYTLGDLVQQPVLLDSAKQGLVELAAASAEAETAMVVGLPIAVGSGLYNCAAVVSKGEVRGIVPKINLPNYKEFYEQRWYKSWDETAEPIAITIGEQEVPFGSQQLFQVGDALLGVEICEDLWTMNPPSVRLAQGGATLIANPSASNELVGKSDYRRQLVGQQSARLLLGYIYASADASESTTDVVMSGHQMIAENGSLLAERRALTIGQRLQTADIDLLHIQNERLRDTNVAGTFLPAVECGIRPTQENLRRDIEPYPFVPQGPDAPERLDTILRIQAAGLEHRLRDLGRKMNLVDDFPKMVLGLSGGLDSTLALLAGCQTALRLGKQPGDLIRTLTMPGQASSDQTQTNAMELAEVLGIPNEVIPIDVMAKDQLAALGHDGTTQDITYENVQARLRTSVLFNRANQLDGLVIGTGDLSEIALGWCTYNGDHMSHYNVNASIPKTLVRYLVSHVAEKPQLAPARDTLRDILNTPISPELVNIKEGEIEQKTEDIIGPYALHDFFLYHFVRWNESPAKISYLAQAAFQETYNPDQIERWLGVFMEQFFNNQWKRSVATDGPKVGSVSLSPRGDWRMPSDIYLSSVWQ